MGYGIWFSLVCIFIVTWVLVGIGGILWYLIQRCWKSKVEWISGFLWWITVSVMLFKGSEDKADTALRVLFSPAAVFTGLLLLSGWMWEVPWKLKLMDNVPVVGKQINRWALNKSTGLDFPLFDVGEVQFKDNFPDYTVKVQLKLEDTPCKKEVIDAIKKNGCLEIAGEEFEYFEGLCVDDDGNVFYVDKTM